MFCTGEFFLYSVAASKHTKVSENAVVCLGRNNADCHSEEEIEILLLYRSRQE